MDTVKSVSIAFATSSKWKRFWCQFLSFITGLLMLPSSNSRYVPLKAAAVTSPTVSPQLPFYSRVSLSSPSLELFNSSVLKIVRRKSVERRVKATTTTNDTPYSNQWHNLLALVLRHFRCIGTTEKFALNNTRNPLAWSRSLGDRSETSRNEKATERTDTFRIRFNHLGSRC